MNEWDYIIIGAGASGCALAYELAKSGENTVLLLESGGHNVSPSIRIPALGIRGISCFDWGYVSEPDPSRNGRAERWVRGHVLGGSTSINGTIFVRGAKADYDRWATLGNEGWSYADVLPLFIEMENFDQGGDLRGRTGPLSIRTVRRVHPLTKAFIESVVAAGYPSNPDYNSGSQEGVSLLQLTQKNGLRCSAADAFIKPLKGKRNFQLMLNTRVDRILFDGIKADGVAIQGLAQSSTVRGRRIIISAGAINSPKLLMLSGIGNADELKQCGINVRVSAPEVGKNLREHPLLRLIYKSRMLSNNLTGGWRQKLGIGWQFIAHRQGPLASPIEAVAFLKTRPHLPLADIQLHFMSIGALCPADHPKALLDSPSVTIFMNKSYSKSSGSVRIQSNDPTAAPLIEPRLYEHPEDLATMMRGVETVRTIVGSGPFRNLLDEEITPGAGHQSEAEFKEYIASNTELAYHPVGTCRMGVDPNAVVAPDLTVNGAENLWIADASIMPDLTSGNTAAACMMIGLKLGRQLKARRRHDSPQARAA